MQRSTPLLRLLRYYSFSLLLRSSILLLSWPLEHVCMQTVVACVAHAFASGSGRADEAAEVFKQRLELIK